MSDGTEQSPATPAAPTPTSSPPEDRQVLGHFNDATDDDVATDDDFLSRIDEGEDEAPASQPTPAPAGPTPSVAPAAPAIPATVVETPQPAPNVQLPSHSTTVPTGPTQIPAVPALPTAVATPVAPPAAPTAPAQTAEQILAARAAQRAGFVEQLADQVYRLGEKDLEALDLTLEQGKVYSRLASQIHMTVLESATQAIANLMPQIIDTTLRQRSADAENDEKFFAMFPALRDHVDKVLPIATTFKQLNPNMPLDDAMKAVGELAHSMLGLAKAPAVAAPTPPAAPAKPAKLPPFAPVTGAPRSAPASTKAAPQNPWEALSNESEDDED